MTTEILREIRRVYGNYDYKLFNTYWYGWEADFGAISSSGYIVEVEVKVSRSDFKADFKKADKHRYLTNHRAEAILENKYPFYGSSREETMNELLNQHLSKTPYDFYIKRDQQGPSSHVTFCRPATRIPNRFYYACQENLIKIEEVPKYAGLYYYNPSPEFPYPKITEVKPAPFLHKEKHDKTNTLLAKYYWQHNNLGNTLRAIENGLRGHLDEDGKKLLESFLRKLSI